MKNDELRKINVTIDPDLRDLASGYLGNRMQDVAILKKSLQNGDFLTIRIIGHCMKGSGSGYGFDRLTELGGALEQAAKGGDTDTIVNLIGALEYYLAGIAVVYE